MEQHTHSKLKIVSGHTVQIAWWRGRQKTCEERDDLDCYPFLHILTQRVQCHDSLHLVFIFQTPIHDLVKLKEMTV